MCVADMCACRVWINAGDIVLLGLREYQDGKADVIHKYSPEEARTLKAYGEIPERVIIGNLVEGEEEEEVTPPVRCCCGCC